jgi:hypothetical protein
MTAALGGCANVDTDSSGAWFAKPLALFGRDGGYRYSYSELQESKQDRPLTANDLVDRNGGCPLPRVPASAPGPAPGSPQAVPDGAQLDDGIALGMSECDVISRAGAPSSVQIGKNPNGDRTAVLTFNNGQAAGLYRFERGRLMELDRGAEAPPAPEVVKKKPASKKPRKKNSQA